MTDPVPPPPYHAGPPSFGFLTYLDTRKIGERRWSLTDDLLYRSDLLPGVFRVPRGFQTDYASIPRALWSIFPPVGRYDAAAVLHDAAYAGALMVAGPSWWRLRSPDGFYRPGLPAPPHLLPDDPFWARCAVVKPWGDRLFREAAHACGVDRLGRALMYQAVVTFGNPAQHPTAALVARAAPRLVIGAA